MSRKRLVILGVTIGLVAVSLLAYINRHSLIARFFDPTSSTIESSDIAIDSIGGTVNDLNTPWSIAFLPTGDMLVTEREGRLKRIGLNGSSYEISGVQETSEGGLLGVTLHPDFDDNQKIYFYYTTEQNGQLTNQIDAATLANDRLINQKSVLTDIPAASNHNGGEIKFGPDKKLYVTTGDAAQPRLAQDKQSLAGKILRLNDNGTRPNDNPFDNLVWSYGHRNPQGIAWDTNGQLWSVEHGPSGSETGRDELNKIDKGANYGWPEITGDETREGMISPVIQSGVDETWAPAQLVFANEKLYFTGLRGQSLYEVDIEDEQPTIKRYLTREYGRLRALGTLDFTLYIGTSNRDGRGSPHENDDKILSIPLSAFADE